MPEWLAVLGAWPRMKLLLGIVGRLVRRGLVGILHLVVKTRDLAKDDDGFPA